MKTVVLTVAAAALLLAGATSATAQPGEGHHSYHRGQRVSQDDWAHAQPVDYRAHHLRSPPRGYEWREVNGQYILAAVATGVIASIILNGGH